MRIWNGMPSQENMPTIILIKLLNSVHRGSGFWVPEQGVFWEHDSSTEGSIEESTNGSSSDGSSDSDNS
jgi:hypothetical protein